MPQKRNLASVVRATRTGGKKLADLTGNPEDVSVRPAVRPSQRKLAELVKGFVDLGKK